MKNLSERQQVILDFIREFTDEHGYPPTVRDIQYGCDISSTSVVAYNLDILKREGLLRRDPQVSRGLEVVGRGASIRPARETVAVPLMGAIAAGEPFPLPQTESWSDAASQELVDLPQSIAGSGERVYALRVKGESMIDALITDGDLVIMEQTSRVSNGQMAAVRVVPDDETTLKYFFLEGPQVRLQPANTQMRPIMRPAKDVEVLSRVIAVWRDLGQRRN